MTIKRINELPEGSGSLTNDDIFLFMDDPSGSAITKKINLNQLINSVPYTVSNIVSGSGVSINNSSGIFTINAKLVSDPTSIPGASSITNIVQISQNDYDNLISTDPNTIYIINT